MRTLIFLLSLIVLQTAVFAAQINHQQQDSLKTTISAQLNPNSSISLILFDKYYRTLSFKNTSKKDTVISQILEITKPTLLSYNNMLMLPSGPVERSYPIFIVPGDKVVIKNGQDGAILLHSSTGLKCFADSILSFPKSYHWSYENESKLLKKEGLKKMIEHIQERFIQNEANIYTIQDPQVNLSALRLLNSNIKYTSISKLLSDQYLTPSATSDSLYQDLYHQSQNINSINNMAVSWAIIRWNAIRTQPKLKNGNVWNWIKAADTDLKKTPLYTNYLTELLAYSFMQIPEDLNTFSETIADIKNESAAIDTLFEVSVILKKTYSDFKEARANLKSYANGRYSYIIESDETAANHELKTIQNLPNIPLTDFYGKKIDFKTVIANPKYKFTIIDFWASWCVPCIAEIPFMKKVSSKFKGKPVRFVSISIDEDNKTSKWIAAAKQNNILNQPFQYRLINFRTSALTKLVNLKTIPRYLMIDNKGNIISEDFLKPSSPQFEFKVLEQMSK